MAEITWIKIMTDIFDNRKIKMIDAMPERDAIIVIWFKLLMLAGKTNDNGMVYFTEEMPYTEEMLSTLFARPLQVVRLALATFEQFKMIERGSGAVIIISSWDKYQNVDRMTEIREYNRLAKQRSREQKKLSAGDVNDKSMTSQHRLDTDTDIDTEKEKNKGTVDKPPPTKRFIPPTLEEVTEYCRQRGKGVNPEKWMDHYTSNGWKVGRNSMKDWKAAVRKWEGNDFGGSGIKRKVSFQEYGDNTDTPMAGIDLLAEARAK